MYFLKVAAEVTSVPNAQARGNLLKRLGKNPSSRASARFILRQRTYCFGENEVSTLNKRIKWLVESRTCAAKSRT